MQKQTVPKKGWYAWAGGLALALFLFLVFPAFEYYFYYLIIIIHEFGHMITSWLFGYPALVSFDFVYGGGYSPTLNRNTFVLIGVYAVFIFLLYRFRSRKHINKWIIALVAVYTLVGFSKLHGVIIDFMGHGMELVFATIFLYRGLSGYAVKIPLERPLYAFCGFYIQFHDIGFAHQLITSAAYRAEYSMSKGGGHVMDFDRIADQIAGGNVSLVAAIFFILCLLPPFMALAYHEYKPRLPNDLRVRP
mgnify:CR=1 FL=1